MIKFHHKQPPHPNASQMILTLRCPHCGIHVNTALVSTLGEQDGKYKPDSVVLTYICTSCKGIIPIQWKLEHRQDNQHPIYLSASEVLPSVPEFDFEFVPDDVKREIQEALACISVNAYHGFGAVCRRAVQAICTSLGAQESSKVANQIKEAVKLGGIDEETAAIAEAIMITGHDGAHPHLPEVSEARAAVLLEILQDLTRQLYTRRGKLREAVESRKQAIEDRKRGAEEDQGEDEPPEE